MIDTKQKFNNIVRSIVNKTILPRILNIYKHMSQQTYIKYDYLRMMGMGAEPDNNILILFVIYNSISQPTRIEFINFLIDSSSLFPNNEQEAITCAFHYIIETGSIPNTAHIDNLINVISAVQIGFNHNKLPCYNTDEKHENYKSPIFNDCTLCQNSIIGYYRELPCGHLFHLECKIEQWLKNNTKCPNCRKDLREYYPDTWTQKNIVINSSISIDPSL
jgi:hypothetical protein